MTRQPVWAIATIALLAASGAQSQERPFRYTPDDMAAMSHGEGGPGSSGMAAIETTVVNGSPSLPGPYTIRLVVPPHTRIAPHTHRDSRTGVVASGDWFFGYGPEGDERQVLRLPPGSYYSEPSNVAHFARTGEEPVVIFLFGVGPTDTVFSPTSPPPAP